MNYFYIEQDSEGTVVRHILTKIGENSWVTFPDKETNLGPERASYLEWLAEGNLPELWNPEP